MTQAAFGTIRHVHHLDGATFRPAPFVRLPTHVVVLECDQGIVLIDAGLATDDLRHPGKRLGPFVFPLAPVLDEKRTILRQIEQLGFRSEDVTDIVATHLDYDHIGGATDFSGAQIHTTGAEFDAAITRRGPRAQIRYRPAHLAATANVVTYAQPDTQVLGLPAHCIDDSEQVFLVPMPGHTDGHAAVAVHDPRRGWLIAAGDAAMHRGAIIPGHRAPWPARAAERLLAMDAARLDNNHRTLSELGRDGHRVFCSHDPVQLAALGDETARIGRMGP